MKKLKNIYLKKYIYICKIKNNWIMDFMFLKKIYIRNQKLFKNYYKKNVIHFKYLYVISINILKKIILIKLNKKWIK